MINIIFMYVPYWIFVGMSSLLYMKDLGVSLAHFGYYQGSFAMVYALGCVLFGMIIHRYSHKKMLSASSLIYIISIITIALVTILDSHNPLLITLAFMPFIISQIIPSNILYPLSLSLIPPAKGRVTAVLQGGRLIFSAISLQLTGYFYEGTFRNIGIIIIAFILMALITQRSVIRNPAIMSVK